MIHGALRAAAVAALVSGLVQAQEAPWPGGPERTEAGLEPPRSEETNPARLLGHLAIRSYQRFASPFLPARCAFFPSCSAYVLAAVSSHGLINGTILGADRIMRCHGFAALGGYEARAQDGLFSDPPAGKSAPLPWISRFGL